VNDRAVSSARAATGKTFLTRMLLAGIVKENVAVI